MAFRGDYEVSFSHLKNLGYQGVELLIRDPATVDVPTLEALLKAYDLELAVIGTSPMQIMDKLFLLHPEESVCREARNRFHGLLALCRHFNVPALLGKYRGHLFSDDLTPMTELVRDLCMEAERYGVKLLLEPQNPASINNINSMADALDFLKTVDSPALGLMADIFHMGITEQSICDSLRSIAPHLGFVHMSDSNRMVPGQASLPIMDVMKTLRNIDFDGFVSLEIRQVPDSATAAAEAISYLQKEV